MHIGFDILPTITTQISPSVGEKNPIRFSPCYGIVFNREIQPNKIFVETGIYTINRGYGYKVDVYNQYGTLFGRYLHSEHMHHLSIPLKIGFKSDILFIDVGPSFNYLYARRLKKDKLVLDKNLDSNIKKVRFGGDLSMGVKIQPRLQRRMLYTVGTYVTVLANPVYFNVGVRFTMAIQMKKKNKSFHR